MTVRAYGAEIDRPSIAAGGFRTKCELVEHVQTKDSIGGNVAMRTVRATVWADLKPLSAEAIARAGALNLQVSHRATIRFRQGVGIKNWYLQTPSVLLRIDAAYDPNGRRDVLVLDCVSGDPGAH